MVGCKNSLHFIEQRYWAEGDADQHDRSCVRHYCFLPNYVTYVVYISEEIFTNHAQLLINNKLCKANTVYEITMDHVPNVS